MKTAAHCAAIVAVVLLLSGCALAGRTFGRYVDDKTITGTVKLSLAARHLSHLRRVNVDVHDATVYLTGTVNDLYTITPSLINSFTYTYRWRRTFNDWTAVTLPMNYQQAGVQGIAMQKPAEIYISVSGGGGDGRAGRPRPRL